MKLRYLFLLLAFLFPISSFAANDYSAIESEIFTFQKGFISQLKDTLQITSSGIMQTGDMRMSASFRIPYFGSGKVSLSADRYSVIVDRKTGNSDIDYRGRVSFEVKWTDTSYNYDTDTYVTKPKEFSGYVDFEVMLTQVGKDAYIKLGALDGALSWDTETKLSFEMALKKGKTYVGKTYKIPRGNYTTDIDPRQMQESIYHSLAVLESYPLFSVKSKNTDESYVLKENRKTIKMLGWGTRNIEKDILTYSSSSGSQMIRISPKKNPKNNYLILSLTNGSYNLVGKIYERTRYSKTDMTFALSKDAFTLRSRDRSSTLSIDWNNGKLIVDMETTGYDAHHFQMSGSLAPDLRNIDLTLHWDGKKIGSIVSKSLGSRVDYSMNFAFSDEMYDILLDMVGSYTQTFWNYTITPPSIYELLD